nr:protein Iojap, chloroplastic [Ipomoea batatas]
METYTGAFLSCASLPGIPISGHFRPALHAKPSSKRSLSSSSNVFALLSSARNFIPPICRNKSSARPCSTVFSRMAAVGSNMSEDTDDMFDDLIEKYGKVVYRRNDNKSASEEVDDDAESLSFAVAAAKVANEVKAADIKVLFVKPLVYWTRFFIIATAFSRPQIDAIGTRIRDMAEEQYGRAASGDTKPNSWMLLDFGDVVVHIFLPEQREFYNLEEFYANATPVDLPFENQQFRHSKGF